MSSPSKGYAVAYCRVSTDEQAKEGLSIETQEKVCIEAITRDGYTLHSIHKDEGRSGKNMNRPAIREVIRLINEQTVHAVYAINSDRVGRNTLDFLILKKLLKEKGVALKLVQQPELENDSATNRAMNTIVMGFNQMQRDITSEKVISVMSEIAKAGYFPTSPPSGYHKAKNPDPNVGKMGRNILVIDPVMGPFITELFRLYAHGNTNVYELGDIMYEKGLRNRAGRRVQSNAIYRILRNRIYLGEVSWRDINIKDGKHTPLVDEDTFNRVQGVLEDKNKHACRRRKYEWLLSGMVVCPHHERRYTAEWHLGKKVAYYHCSNPRGCGKYLEQGVLEDMVADKFKELEFSDEFVALVIEKAKGIFFSRRKKYDARRQALVNRRTALENRREVAENKLFEEVISNDDFSRIRTQTQTDITQIEGELIELENQRELDVDVAQEVLLLTKDIYRAYKEASNGLKRQYLTFFWDRFEVMNGIILKSVPAPLFESLLQLEAAFYWNDKNGNREEPLQNKGVILSQFQGAYRESNPN